MVCQCLQVECYGIAIFPHYASILNFELLLVLPRPNKCAGLAASAVFIHVKQSGCSAAVPLGRAIWRSLSSAPWVRALFRSPMPVFAVMQGTCAVTTPVVALLSLSSPALCVPQGAVILLGTTVCALPCVCHRRFCATPANATPQPWMFAHQGLRHPQAARRCSVPGHLQTHPFIRCL